MYKTKRINSKYQVYFFIFLLLFEAHKQGQAISAHWVECSVNCLNMAFPWSSRDSVSKYFIKAGTQVTDYCNSTTSDHQHW